MSISASGFRTRYSGTFSVAVIIGSLRMTASRQLASVLSTDERELALLLMGDREPLCTSPSYGKQLEEGPGEMFPWLRTCIATTEDQHSVLIPHVRWLTTVNDSNPRAFSTSWPQKTICSQVHIPTQTHIPNKKKKN